MLWNDVSLCAACYAVMPLPLYIFVQLFYSGETGLRQVFPGFFAAGEPVNHTTKQPF